MGIVPRWLVEAELELVQRVTELQAVGRPIRRVLRDALDAPGPGNDAASPAFTERSQSRRFMKR